MIAALFHPVTILLATLCIQWVALAKVGPFTVQVPYVTLLLVVFFVFTGPRKIAGAAAYLRSNISWVAPWAVYLPILLAVLVNSDGANIAPRQIFYLIGGLALGACVATARDIRLILRIGAGLGIAVFIIVIEMMARGIGLSWYDAIYHFVSDGNLKFVTYSFFRDIFNSIDPRADLAISAARKNDIAACVLVLALVFRSASKSPQRDLAGTLFLGVAAALLILLNTRSVLIVAALSLIVATVVGAVMHPGKKAVSISLKLLAVVALGIFAAQLSLGNSAATNTLGERFAFDDYSTSARMSQYDSALASIEKHPLTGAGYFLVDGRPIHNLFLGAWVHAGIFAFMLVVAFYVALFLRWAATLLIFTRSPEIWVLPIAFEWIAPLPIMPLFRVWLSGDAGHPYLSEWIAIAIFFGCCLANELAKKRAGWVRGTFVAKARAKTRQTKISVVGR